MRKKLSTNLATVCIRSLVYAIFGIPKKYLFIKTELANKLVRLQYTVIIQIPILNKIKCSSKYVVLTLLTVSLH